MSEQPRAPGQAGVSEEKAMAIMSSSDCNGPWGGYPHCEGKMAVSDLFDY